MLRVMVKQCPWCGNEHGESTILCLECERVAKAMKSRHGTSEEKQV